MLLGVLDSHCVAGAKSGDGVQNALTDDQALPVVLVSTSSAASKAF